MRPTLDKRGVGARLGLPRVAGRGGLLAAMAIDSLGSGLFLPFGVLYFLHTTTLSLTRVGAGLTLAGVFALPTPLAIAGLVDRWQAKTVIAVGNLASAGAFVAYLFVRTEVALIAAALLANVGQRTFWTATRALIADVAGAGERPRWFALQSMTRNAGYGVGGLLGAGAVSTGTVLGFHLLAAVNAASYLAAAMILLRARLPHQPARGSQAEPGRDTHSPGRPTVAYPTVLSDRRLWSVTATNLVFVLCVSALDVMLSVYLVDALHQPASLGGVLFTVNTVLVVTGQTIITARTAGRSTTRVLQAAALAWAASFAILWALASAPSVLIVPGLLVAITVFTLAETLHGPTINTLAIDLAPTHAPGRHLAIYQFSWSVGTALAPLALTWLLARGTEWPWITLIALCALTAVALACYRRWPPRTVANRPPRHDEQLKPP